MLQTRGRAFHMLVIAGCIAAIALSATKGSAQPAVLRIGGSGGPSVAIRPVVAAYEAAFPGVQVKIFDELGSTGGIRAVASGALDAALTGRGLKQSERDHGLVEIEYARTPLVLAANSKVPVSNLTTRDLVEIYQGTRLVWPDGSRIRLVLRPETDSDTLVLKTLSPAMEQALRAAFSRPGLLITATDQETLVAIQEIPGAIATSILALVAARKHPVKVLALNGVVPTPKAIADGSYPLAKRLYLVTGPQSSPLAERFVTFVRSVWGRRILSETGHWVDAQPSR